MRITKTQIRRIVKRAIRESREFPSPDASALQDYESEYSDSNDSGPEDEVMTQHGSSAEDYFEDATGESLSDYDFEDNDGVYWAFSLVGGENYRHDEHNGWEAMGDADLGRDYFDEPKEDFGADNWNY